MLKIAERKQWGNEGSTPFFFFLLSQQKPLEGVGDCVLLLGGCKVANAVHF